MKAFTISLAIIGAALVTGCSNGKAASSNQQPQIVYQGDSPEAARYKAHMDCLKFAYGTNKITKGDCDIRFGESGVIYR